MIDGVCGGLADYLNVDSTVVRILWVASFFIGGIGAIAYILAMIIVPVNPHSDKKIEQIRKPSAGLIIGLIFIIGGLLFLLRYTGLFPWRWSYHLPRIFWWNFHYSLIIPIFLIIGGALAIFFVFKHEKDNQKMTNKKQSAPGAKKLYRSSENKVIAGVCGGIGEYFNIDPTFIRVGLAILTILTLGFLGVIAYIVLFIVLPEKQSK
jgi:phage shock protein C